jgi:Domain of unknown function (DUF1707)/Cell wall-active antibiotics response 4TMS YvqF
MPNKDPQEQRAADLELRASDSDRERVADLLREAAAQGRIDMDELDERLEAVYGAKTYGELVPITRDLPADGASPRLVPSAAVAPAASSGALVVGSAGPTGSSTAIAVMSGANRNGSWIVPKRFTAFAFWGGSVIDLREARFESAVTRIRATAIMGGVQVLVPEGVRVEVHGFGLMGGFNESGTKPATASDAPVVQIGGLAFWGGVLVRHMRRKKNDDAKQDES